MTQKVKNRLFEILDMRSDDLPSKSFGVFIMTLISLNVIAVVLETVESLSSQYLSIFWTF